MSYRVAIFAMAVAAIWGGVAFFTGHGALAFLAPGDFIAGVIFPQAPGTYVSYGAAGPNKAIMELAITLAMRSFVHAMWCAVAFWLLVSVVLGAIAGTQQTGWWDIGYIDTFYAYANGTQRFLDDTDNRTDPNNVPAYCGDFPTFCRFASGFWQVYGTYLANIVVHIEYEHFNQDALSFAQAAGTAYDVPASSADPTQAETILEAKLGAQTGETVASVLRYPVPRPDLPPEVTPEPPMRPMPPEWLPPATEPTFYPRPQLKWKILGKVTIWACALFCIDKGPEDENELMDWYYFGLEWALYDILQRSDPSSQVKAVIGEGEGEDVYIRIPSAAAAWGALYFSFGIDPETGRQAPFSSEPTPWPAPYQKFLWSMNSGWLATLMGKQAQFYDIQLYGPRPPPRGIVYPCERKTLQGYPLRDERSWQGTMPFTDGTCQFF